MIRHTQSDNLQPIYSGTFKNAPITSCENYQTRTLHSILFIMMSLHSDIQSASPSSKVNGRRNIFIAVFSAIENYEQRATRGVATLPYGVRDSTKVVWEATIQRTWANTVAWNYLNSVRYYLKVSGLLTFKQKLSVKWRGLT